MRGQLPLCLELLAVLGLVVAACATRPATPTATQVPMTEAPRADQAAAGEQRFATYCRGCHGNGFTTAKLNEYKVAERLYDYVKARMPPGNPNAISEQDRYDLVAYLLAKAGLIKVDQPVNADTLSTLSFE
jgi:mono/diheme cytochrome c family protein